MLVTAFDLKTARRLTRIILRARAAACVNLIPRLESHYWWQGKLVSGKEVLLLIKSTRAKLPGLEKLIVANHSYDTPEFLVLKVSGGNERYLDWVAKSVA